MPAERGRYRKVYGARKELEMHRSVLPSTNRGDARRDLARIRRRARRLVAVRLATYRGPVGFAYEMAVDDEADARWWPDNEIRYAVLERRDDDKVGPLIRWARARTRHLSQEDCPEALRRMLPPGVIGDHALSHLERCRDLTKPAEPA